MIDLKSQTLEEMTATLKEMGEPAMRLLHSHYYFETFGWPSYNQ